MVKFFLTIEFVQLLSCVWHFVSPWTAACQASLCFNHLPELAQTQVCIFLGSKITVENVCSHDIKRCFLLGRKVMRNLDSIIKSRDITLSTKVCVVKAVVFSVVMNGCESWAIKKDKHWRIDAFEMLCWRRLLRVSWTARRSN